MDENKNMTLEAFIQFNTEVSSEMFVSIMAILNERLPCAQFYFRQRRRFKAKYFQQIAPEPGPQQPIQNLLMEPRKRLSEYGAPEEEKNSPNYSPVRAIA